MEGGCILLQKNGCRWFYLKSGKPGPRSCLCVPTWMGCHCWSKNTLAFCFKKWKTNFNGQENKRNAWPVVHDAHMAMLMAVAKNIEWQQKWFEGFNKIYFQPGGRRAWVQQRLPAWGWANGERRCAWKSEKWMQFFGLHIQSLLPSGTLNYKPRFIDGCCGWIRYKSKR